MRKTLLTLTLSLSVIGTAAWAEEAPAHSSSGNSTSSDIQYEESMEHQAAGEISDHDDVSFSNDDQYVGEEAGTIDESDDLMIYDDQAAGTAETTTADMDDMDSALKNEAVGVKPQVGVLLFDNPLTGDSEARAAAGATVDFNITGLVREDPSPLFVGLSTGALYSRVGSPNADFIGSDDASNTTASLLLIPANAKIGWNLTDSFRLSAHGGGNVIYQNQAAALGVVVSPDGGSDWSIFPNVGADLELGIGRNSALILRPDVTFTDGEEIFTGTLGFSIAMG